MSEAGSADFAVAPPQPSAVDGDAAAPGAAAPAPRSAQRRRGHAYTATNPLAVWLVVDMASRMPDGFEKLWANCKPVEPFYTHLGLCIVALAFISYKIKTLAQHEDEAESIMHANARAAKQADCLGYLDYHVISVAEIDGGPIMIDEEHLERPELVSSRHMQGKLFRGYDAQTICDILCADSPRNFIRTRGEISELVVKGGLTLIRSVGLSLRNDRKDMFPDHPPQETLLAWVREQAPQCGEEPSQAPPGHGGAWRGMAGHGGA